MSTIVSNEVNSSRTSATAIEERLIWLIRVRWAAFIAQAVVFFAAWYLLNRELSWQIFAGIEVLIAASNLALSRLNRNGISEGTLGGILLFDVILLTVLLNGYGGPANPFSMVYLVHVVLAALCVDHRWTWIVAIASSLCFAALFWFSDDASSGAMSHHHMASGTFDLHLQGMLLAFVILAFLIAGLVSRMRIAIDMREREIFRSRATEERLAALTQLAAGAAHELGTPLSTIKVVLSELLRDISTLSTDELREELTCVGGQLDRCAEILQAMAPQAGVLVGEMPGACSARQIAERARGMLPQQYRERLVVSVGEGLEKLVMPSESVAQALSSLAKNAFEASDDRKPVSLNILRSEDRVVFHVNDQGDGMDQETVRKLGEPFFTTKDPGKGTGLGIFLCRLLLSRLEGMIDFQSERGNGTRVSMSIPLQIQWSQA